MDGRPFTSQQRLAQLRSAETLYNAGLFNSALLVTGIHLCTVGHGELWYQSKALSRYARCLTRLGEHRRSIPYYRKAIHLDSAPAPADIQNLILSDNNQAITTVTDTSANSETSTQKQSVSAGVALLMEAGLDSASMAKERQGREQVLGNLSKAASRVSAMKRKAEIASATKAALGSGPLPSALTAPTPSSIPPVVPQSSYMAKNMASRAAVEETAQKRRQALLNVPPKSTNKGPRTSKDEITGTASDHAIDQEVLHIKMDYARSCLESGDYISAGQAIMDIPERSRTVEMYLMFVQLCRKGVNVISEKSCWECIAELQPLAVEAYVQLLRSKVALSTILNMIPPESFEKNWMRLYLQGMDNFFRMKYKAALVDFTALDESYPGNVDVKLRMALCLRWMGKLVRSAFMFSQVRKLDNGLLDEMCQYGEVLKTFSKFGNLNKLASDLLTINDKHPDTWCVQAIYWEMKGNREKALQLVAKALQLKPDHSGALQLQGQLYLETSHVKALQSFRDAKKIDENIAIYDGLVDTYILMERRLEAAGAAKEALKLMPDSAHALAIYGKALYSAGEYDSKAAQDVLSEALQKDPGCVPAAMTLIMIMEHSGHFEDALLILDGLLDYQQPEMVHLRKAEIYTSMEEWEQALSSYQCALSANPDSAKAREGMTHVEKIISGGDDEEEEFEEGEEEMEELMEGMEEDIGHHVDEDDILTGEEDATEEYVDEQQQQQEQDYMFSQSHHDRGRGLSTPVGHQQQQHSRRQVPPRLQRPARHLSHSLQQYHQPQHQQQQQQQQQQNQQQHQHSQHQLQLSPQSTQRRGSMSTPGFGMSYQSQSPTRQGHHPRFPPVSQRDREYDELDDRRDMNE